MRTFSLFFVALCCCCLLLPCPQAQAAAGFRTIGLWQQANNLRLDINVWYPTSRAVTDLSYTPWVIRAAPNAPVYKGQYPIIILSHATAGTRFSYHELAAWLANCGYIVAAPTHLGDNMDDMHLLYTTGQIEMRILHIQATIAALEKDKELAPFVDSSRIGLVGFNAGGTAAMLMGGALASASGWKNYCEKTTFKDPYCAPSAKGKIDLMAASIKEGASAQDQRIKAVVAISPLFPMFFSGKRDTSVVMLFMHTKEDARYQQDSHDLAQIMQQVQVDDAVAQADVGALMSACPRALAEELPELCYSVSSDQRATLQIRLRMRLEKFFAQYLDAAP
ncbi:MAG: dienelactone hydrolase family protein [Desulfovibrionaceae bacterium]|nr:dienelactone hydrolase family protein [Desulfovibrionaceae bacterium]